MGLNFVDINRNDNGRVFALLAGEAGIGKTTQATTFPRKETFILSVENGLLSIRGSGYAAEEVKTYERAMEILEDEIGRNKWIKHICIDSLSEIYDLITKEANVKFSAKQNFAKHEYIEAQLMDLIRAAKELDIDCFFICHTKEEKNGLNLEQELAFQGKLPEKIKRQFDVIIHYDYFIGDNGKKERVFITSTDISKIAKKRASPWLGIKIEDYEQPNLYQLTKKLLGKN